MSCPTIEDCIFVHCCSIEVGLHLYRMFTTVVQGVQLGK
jgi:hypothetical protein